MYEGECYFECPDNSILEDGVCWNIEYEFEDHLIIILSCFFGVLVVMAGAYMVTR